MSARDDDPMRLPQLTRLLLSRAAAAATPGATGDAWALARRATARAEAGAKVLQLTVGSPDTPAPWQAVSAAVEALQSTDRRLWSYAGALGLPALRQALAASHNVPFERVAVVPGAQAGLFLSLRLLLGQEGGEVLLPTPCYSTYEDTVRAAGGTPVLVHPAPGDGFTLRVSALGAAVTARTRGVLVTTPNNPTGALLSSQTLQQLGELCHARGLWCISDETYTHLVFGGKEHLSAAHVPLLADRTVVVGSMSKALLRPGWRLGWLVAPLELMPGVEALSEASHFGLSPFLQHAACEVLRADTLPGLRAAESGRYEGRRDALLRGLGEQPGDGAPLCQPLCPDGGMFVMIDVRASGVSSQAFAEHLLEAYDVAALPGEGFGGGAALGHLRVGLLADEDTMLEAGRRIAACAAELAAGAASAPPAVGSALLRAPRSPPDPLAGAVALFAVRLDASNAAWTAAMLSGLRAAAGPGCEVREWREGAGDAQLAGAEALFCWDPPPGLMRSLMPSMRLVSSLGAGVDHCSAEHASLVPAVPLVRCVDPLAAQRLAQYALWAALHLSRRMEEYGAQQAHSRWDSSPGGADPCDTVVGVMGLGAMGAAAAATLARNGFLVHGWRKGSAGGRPTPSGLARVFAGDDALPSFLASLHILVVVMPLTDATRGVLGAEALAMLPRGCSLVNVGRAEVVDQAALLAALDEGHVRSAILDVAPTEPLPSESPLWRHPRVRLTPHVAGPSSGAAGAQHVIDNWRRLRRGERLLDVVT